ncbi:MAG: Bacterial toxin ue of phage lysozyme, C-term [Candidatus Woesearchaeota archaeon]|nr:Bacterial toxin ue of phage lysozyme, C-term [Candidatus Woesearchaeota archaeon]
MPIGTIILFVVVSLARIKIITGFVLLLFVFMIDLTLSSIDVYPTSLENKEKLVNLLNPSLPEDVNLVLYVQDETQDASLSELGKIFYSQYKDSSECTYIILLDESNIGFRFYYTESCDSSKIERVFTINNIYRIVLTMSDSIEEISRIDTEEKAINERSKKAFSIDISPYDSYADYFKSLSSPEVIYPAATTTDFILNLLHPEIEEPQNEPDSEETEEEAEEEPVPEETEEEPVPSELTREECLALSEEMALFRQTAPDNYALYTEKKNNAKILATISKHFVNDNGAAIPKGARAWEIHEYALNNDSYADYLVIKDGEKYLDYHKLSDNNWALRDELYEEFNEAKLYEDAPKSYALEWDLLHSAVIELMTEMNYHGELSGEPLKEISQAVKSANTRMEQLENLLELFESGSLPDKYGRNDVRKEFIQKTIECINSGLIYPELSDDLFEDITDEAAPTTRPLVYGGSIEGELTMAGESIANTVYHPSPNSGVTIGIGFDLKFENKDELYQKLRSYNLDEGNASMLASACRLSGSKAEEFVNVNGSKIFISYDVIMKWFEYVHESKYIDARAISTTSLYFVDDSGAAKPIAARTWEIHEYALNKNQEYILKNQLSENNLDFVLEDGKLYEDVLVIKDGEKYLNYDKLYADDWALRTKLDKEAPYTYSFTESEWDSLNPAIHQLITDLNYLGVYKPAIREVNSAIKSSDSPTEQLTALYSLFENPDGEALFEELLEEADHSAGSINEYFFGELVKTEGYRRNEIWKAFIRYANKTISERGEFAILPLDEVNTELLSYYKRT